MTHSEQKPEQLFAHLFKRADGYELYLSPTFRPGDYTQIWRCLGMRQVRELVKKHNAKPWNF